MAEGGAERVRGRAAIGSTLLALVSGVVDLWAVTCLGGPFASVVTGNLVVAGGAAGRGDVAGLWPPLVAVAGFASGVAIWSWAWRRRPATVGWPLAAELVVLGALAVVWALGGGTPPPWRCCSWAWPAWSWARRAVPRCGSGSRRPT